MDQGLAAIWAAIAGLVGAGVGGGFAVWGASIGGRKAVEAAEKQADRTATADHQHWLRQARFDAYTALLDLAQETSDWPLDPLLSTVHAMAGRLRPAISRVQILGDADAAEAAIDLLAPVAGVLTEWRASADPGMENIPPDTTAPWRNHRGDLTAAVITFRRQVRNVVTMPPA